MATFKIPEQVATIVSLLPDDPGIYQFFNKEGTIIYVGKAKNLKKRVSSYFN
ncbi:MAG: GIY-YIG nuclease family protein, partial [Bacteroidota bacterium]